MLLLILCVLSLIPIAYVQYIGLRDAGASWFQFALLGCSLIPVAIGVFLARSRQRCAGLGWLAATMAASAWAVWVGVINPKGSTSSIILVLIPIWNVAVIGPMGALVGWLVLRFLQRTSRQASE